jgi:hypothetical protein
VSIRSFIVPTLTFFTVVAQLSADEPPTIQPSRTVGSVYGKTVTAADIGLTAPIDAAVRFDSRNAAQWEAMGRIMTTFGGPVVDRFVKQQKIDAAANEIEAFRRNWRKMSERHISEMEAQLVKVKADLAAPNLPNEARTKLDQEQANIERIVSALRENIATGVPETMARTFIVSWKTERELHRMYGGRVIFQQAGPEALDARRLLFEEAEKNGDLKFNDAGVRHLFYYYANMKHTVTDDKALEKPWFLDSGN